jgi:TonB family protein
MQGKSIFDWLDQAKTPSRLAALRDALTTVATNPSAVTGTLTPPATEQVYRVGDGVSSPQVIIKQEPEYSTQACDQRIQGKVLLYLVVGTSGSPSEVRVLRSLEPSLDVRVMEAVRKWRFQPGKKDGIPVPVAAQVEVEFRLL